MKPSEMYTKAAALIANHEENLCCYVLDRVGAPEIFIKTMREYYEHPNAAAGYWMSEYGKFSQIDLSPGTRIGRLHRSLGLLFMAEIMKEQEK